MFFKNLCFLMTLKILANQINAKQFILLVNNIKVIFLSTALAL